MYPGTVPMYVVVVQVRQCWAVIVTVDSVDVEHDVIVTVAVSLGDAPVPRIQG